MKRNKFRFIDPRIRFITEPMESEGSAEATEAPQESENEAKGETLGEGGIKALQAEREARSTAEKQIAELNARLKEFEDAQKSDEERKSEAEAEQQRQFEETAKAKAEAESRLLRYEVAADKGIDLKFVNRINGSTKEELEADADAFLELLGKVTPPAPKPDPSAGRGAEQVKPSSLQDAIGQHYN